MRDLLFRVKRNSDTYFIFLFCLLIYTYILKYVSTDIQLHIRQIISINSNEISYPANFLFYFIVNLFSGFTNNIFFMYLVTIILLSFATTAKYIISKKIIISLCWNTIKPSSDSKIYFITLGLFFFFAISDPYSLFVLNKMYLGKFVPIVWHNSTTIFLFPFAILLYWKQLKVFDKLHNTTISDILFLNFLVILNIIIKPSFIFCYAPVTFFFLIYKIKSYTLKSFLLKLTPLITAALFIFIQYFSIYRLQTGSIYKESSSVSISSPFEVLLNWIPIWFLPISLLLSFALPIFCIIIFKDIIRYKPFLYSLCLTIFGLIISAFIMETGPRMFHGNFMWQNVICAYLLFLSTVSFLTPRIINASLKYKYIVIGLFIMHSLSGILYIINIGLTSNFK